MDLHQRNTEIVQDYNAGISCNKIASRFGLSHSRIHQIVHRSKTEEKRRKQSTELLCEIRMFDDIDKKWPIETLVQGLRCSWRAERCLVTYFNCTGVREISLRDLMDVLITNYEEIPNDLSGACPVFKQKHVGLKTYRELLKKISEQDLGRIFQVEWNKRLIKLFCFMKKRWKHIPEWYRQYYEMEGLTCQCKGQPD